VLIAAAVLANGGEPPLVRPLLAAAVGLLAIAHSVLSHRGLLPPSSSDRAHRRARGWFLFTAIALFLVLAFETVPLSPAVLARLSPARAEVRLRAVEPAGAVHAVPNAPPEIRFWQTVVGEADRARIAGLASRSAWFPDDWSPLAINPFAASTALVFYAACGVTLLLAASEPSPRRLLQAIVGVGVGAAAVAFYQYASRSGPIPWLFDPDDAPNFGPRMVGPFPNPNLLGGFLAMAVPPAVGLAVDGWRQSRRRRKSVFRRILPPLAAVFVLLIALFGSVSRGAIGGAAIGVLLVWFFAGRSRRRGSGEGPVYRGGVLDRLDVLLRRIAPGLAAVGILVVAIVYLGPRGRAALDERLEPGRVVDQQLRQLLFRQTLPMVADFPLFGVGLGGWQPAFERYRKYPLLGAQWPHVHNTYLGWTVETGTVGVALTFLVGAALIAWWRATPGVPPAIRWGLLGGVVAILWQDLFDSILLMPAAALTAAVLLGLGANPNWADATAAPSSARRRLVPTAGLLVGAALVIAGYRYLREDLELMRLEEPSVELRFASEDPAVWRGIGALLFNAGLTRSVETVDSFRRAVRSCAGCTDSLVWLARVEDDPDVKLALLDAALYVAPLDVPARIARAGMLRHMGHDDEGLAEITEAVRLVPRLSKHRYLRDPEARGEIARAAEAGLALALEEHPEDAPLLHDAATFERQHGSLERAAALWERAARASGSWDTYGTRAAEALAEADDYEDAERVARKVIRKDPRSPRGYEVLAMTILRPLKHYEEAEAALDRGIRNAKGGAALSVALYDLRRERGDEAGALAALARGASKNPRDPSLAYRLGQAYVARKDYLRARGAFQDAIAADRKRPESYFALAGALERLGEMDAARDNYRRAVKLRPDPRYVAAQKRIEEEFARTERSLRLDAH
jgi:O-antigen ligase/tetratricopeptide (TPR) repeat protein